MNINQDDTTVISWALGEALFQEKGKYVLKLEYNGVIVDKKKVEVRK